MAFLRRAAIACLVCLAGAAHAQDAASPAAAPAAAASPAASPAPSAAADLAATAGAHPLTRQDADAWLDGYMPYALDSGDIAGAVVAIVKDGQVLTERGYGYADVAKRVPVDPEKTLFRPGSVSKLVTWTAVMQLVQQGKLDLDRDVNGYLDFQIPPYGGQPITLRQIMTHTAGFEEAAKDIIAFDPKAVPAFGDYLKAWTPERIYAPGTTPAYSNWATTLAGYIVQRVSGLPFDDYVEQRVFKPLGMNDSTFRQPLPDGLAPQMSLGYARASAPPTPFEIIGPAPAGAMSSTGADMARFMIAHLQGGQGILDPATAATMHDSPLDKVNPASLLPPLSRMELGFFETNLNGREVIGHLGDTTAFHTILHLFIKDGVGLYASFNSAGKDAAVGPLRGALFQDFADRYFPTTEKDGTVAPDVAAEHARMISGQWRNSRRSVSDFVAVTAMLSQTKVGADAQGRLVVSGVHDESGAERRWTEVSPFVWRDMRSHDRLAAQVVDGKVVRWSWELLSPFMVYDRVPLTESAAWMIPAVVASLGLMALSVVYWPVAWGVRRSHRTPLQRRGAARVAHRAAQVGVFLTLALAVAWAATVMTMLSHEEDLSKAFDPLLTGLQLGGLIVLVLATAATAWNVASWPRVGWLARLWGVLALLAVLDVFYFAYVCGLLAMTVHY